MESVKPWYLSKTMILNLLMAVLGVVAVFKPEVAEVVKGYLAPEKLAIAWSVINIVLRIVTKDRVSIS